MIKKQIVSLVTINKIYYTKYKTIKILRSEFRVLTSRLQQFTNGELVLWRALSSGVKTIQ